MLIYQMCPLWMWRLKHGLICSALKHHKMNSAGIHKNRRNRRDPLCSSFFVQQMETSYYKKKNSSVAREALHYHYHLCYHQQHHFFSFFLSFLNSILHVLRLQRLLKCGGIDRKRRLQWLTVRMRCKNAVAVRLNDTFQELWDGGESRRVA